jgi:hypothetical protein
MKTKEAEEYIEHIHVMLNNLELLDYLNTIDEKHKRKTVKKFFKLVIAFRHFSDEYYHG